MPGRHDMQEAGTNELWPKKFCEVVKFFGRYFIYVQCMICLIDATSVNDQAYRYPTSFRHVFSCDKLVRFWHAREGSNLLVNNTAVLKDRPRDTQQEPVGASTDVSDRIVNIIK
jgi:hypothetical protein